MLSIRLGLLDDAVAFAAWCLTDYANVFRGKFAHSDTTDPDIMRTIVVH